jgi:mannose-6-phosphate isomerase-like protein (cupin superfamily)
MTEHESSGGHVAARGEGKELPVVGKLQVSTEQSGGSFEVILLHPGPEYAAGPPPHVHLQRDELFYITKGRFTFVLGTREVEVEEGGTVFVPRGTRHGFKSHPGSQALLIIAPAGEEVRAALVGKYDSTPTDI